MILATDGSPREYFLVIEKAILGVVKAAADIPGALPAAFYVFNIAISDSLKQFS